MKVIIVCFFTILFNTSFAQSEIENGQIELLTNHSDPKSSIVNQVHFSEKLEAREKSEKINALSNEIIILRIGLLGVSVVFILLLVILFFYKYKSNLEKKRTTQRQRKSLIEIDGGNQLSQQLAHSIISLQRKKEFTEEVIARLSELKSIDRNDFNEIKLFITNEVKIDESIIEMENYISETGKEFFIKLDLVHPGLTDNEQKLIALIRMNLSIKQIAIIKNITPQSVKIAKNRLSKKLELEPGSNIYDYLMSL